MQTIFVDLINNENIMTQGDSPSVSLRLKESYGVQYNRRSKENRK